MRSWTPMRSAMLAALRSMFLVLLLASCGSSSAKQDDAFDAHFDCGAIASYAPIVTVVYADTASPVCNPTFTFVDWPDGGPMPPLDGMPYACGRRHARSSAALSLVRTASASRGA